MKEKFAVAFHAFKGAFYEIRREAVRLEGCADTVAGLCVQGGVANDAAASDVVAADFELGFYENDPVGFRFCDGEERGNKECDGNEADVADNDIHLLADIGERQIARVGFLVKFYAWVSAKFPIDLAGASVDSVNPRGSVLQEAIGKAAGGSTDVETYFFRGGNVKGRESGFQFQAAAAHVAKGLQHFEVCVFADGLAGLAGLLPVDKNFARENEGLRFLAGGDKTARHQFGIEALPGFHFLCLALYDQVG